MTAKPENELPPQRQGSGWRNAFPWPQATTMPTQAVREALSAVSQPRGLRGNNEFGRYRIKL